MIVLLPVVICVSNMSDIITILSDIITILNIIEKNDLGLIPGPGIHKMYGITVEERVPQNNTCDPGLTVEDHSSTAFLTMTIVQVLRFLW